MLAYKRLIEILEYKNGNLIRKKTKKIAGHKHKTKGYVIVVIDGKSYREHRLIWFYFHKKWPEKELDHINRIRHDNRIENLREATAQENKFNKGMQKNNKSGKIGVCFKKEKKKWRAQIKINKKCLHLGYYKNFDEAVEARQAAEKKYFGEFTPILESGAMPIG